MGDILIRVINSGDFFPPSDGIKMGCKSLEDERALEETLKVLSIKLVMSLMKLIVFLPSGPQHRTQHIESISAPSRMWPKFSALHHYLPKKDPATNMQ